MPTETSGLKTPLYDIHAASGGKIVPFAGYLLPVQYETGVIAEHMAVRTKCGLFDVSHMGEIILEGPDALKNLNHLLTNDYTVMADGQARYSPMCNEKGGVVDDLIVYKVRDNCYFIVVNAANKDKDYEWMKAHVTGDAALTDISSSVAQLALQGPKALDILKKLAKEEDIPEKYYTCKFNCMIDGMRCIISKTGYTGEDGVEIYLASEEAPRLWNLLIENGQDEGLIPCGLGARDTLRLEASMPLYGHEMDDTITPKEAGLGIFVKMDKEDFIGKKAIEAKGPLTRKRVGLKVTGRGIVREQQAVYADGKQIGITTSGTHCPYLGYPVAMALLDVNYKEPGTAVEVDVRGRRVAAEVVKLPFYKRS
ncbi:MAG: glycine cleavage system aminomethyltransferase GcvT [Enterocloster asparagiformis]|nr:glycine cleavage system aminomethyltransferase GcvT [Enterocloster asparagiformis]